MLIMLINIPTNVFLSKLENTNALLNNNMQWWGYVFPTYIFINIVLNMYM